MRNSRLVLNKILICSSPRERGDAPDTRVSPIVGEPKSVRLLLPGFCHAVMRSAFLLDIAPAHTCVSALLFSDGKLRQASHRWSGGKEGGKDLKEGAQTALPYAVRADERAVRKEKKSKCERKTTRILEIRQILYIGRGGCL